MNRDKPNEARRAISQLPATAPRWTTLIALTATLVAGSTLAFPRWKLVGLLGGNPLYSKPSIAFGPGKVEAIFLVLSAGACLSLIRNPTHPAPRSFGAFLFLAGAIASSLVLASIPSEAVGYSLTATPAVRIGTVSAAAAMVALLVPYGTLFQARILSPEERQGQPHPVRESPPFGSTLEQHEPG